MKDVYEAWIRQHVPTNKEAYGYCASVSLAMVEAFPELRRTGGIYDCPIWGERVHWWLVTESGEVIDPTVQQFPSHGIGEYRELKPGIDRIPSGVCMDCGETTYDGATFCSDACTQATLAYLNNMVTL